jgi:hypothetical protein
MVVNTKRTHRAVLAATYWAVFAWSPESVPRAAVRQAALRAGSFPQANQFRQDQDSDTSEKKPKLRMLHWGPPNVDTALHFRPGSPPCVLSDALQLAAARANELVTNLENFTAQEDIDYEARGATGVVRDHGSGTFDYVVVIQQGRGGLSLQESRTPVRGTYAFPGSTRDVGLPSLALIFLPEMQGDYDMSCEGTTEWKERSAWVVHFQQRKDKPNHTVAFRDGASLYPAKLKGRAWIDTESGEVMHLETSMMGSITALHVRDWYLSVDYAPVRFRTQNVSIWLPRGVDAYCEYEDSRTIAYHSFSNFMLFSVRTDQQIQKPQTP